MRSPAPALLVLTTLIGTGTAQAVVLHPDAPAVTSHPLADVMTTWAGASAVAIAPNWFIATHHQGGSLGSNVTFGGVAYDVVERIRLIDPARPEQGYENAVDTDLVLWRIDALGAGPSTLSAWTPIVESPVSFPTAITIGGFGDTRSGAAQTFSNPGGEGTGYAVSGGGTLVWGTNDVGSEFVFPLDLNNDNVDDSRGMLYMADFDGPNGTAEASLAAGDSGGGWFIDDGGWKLLALTHGVNHPLRAIYDEPEILYGLSIPEYAGQIQTTIPEPASVFALALGMATLARGRGRRQNP